MQRGTQGDALPCLHPPHHRPNLGLSAAGEAETGRVWVCRGGGNPRPNERRKFGEPLSLEGGVCREPVQAERELKLCGRGTGALCRGGQLPRGIAPCLPASRLRSFPLGTGSV